MIELKPCPMTADEAIASLEMFQALMLFDPMTGETRELREENRDNQDLYNACIMALSALRRAQPANEPLTLEQLREMDGEPVYCVYPGCSTGGEWFLVNSQGAYKNGGFLSFRYYGKWLAHRRKPEPEGKIEK